MKERVVEIGGRVISFGETDSDFRYRGILVNLIICPSEEAWGGHSDVGDRAQGAHDRHDHQGEEKGLLINSRGIWTREELLGRSTNLQRREGRT